MGIEKKGLVLRGSVVLNAWFIGLSSSRVSCNRLVVVVVLLLLVILSVVEWYWVCWVWWVWWVGWWYWLPVYWEVADYYLR